MGNWGNIYRSRARTRRATTQKQLGEEGKLVREGVQAAIQAELYDRSPLPVTRGLYNAVVLQFVGNAFVVGFDRSKAPYAKRRVEMKGISKKGKHKLDMDPKAYLRAHTYPTLFALRRKRLAAERKASTVRIGR